MSVTNIQSYHCKGQNDNIISESFPLKAVRGVEGGSTVALCIHVMSCHAMVLECQHQELNGPVWTDCVLGTPAVFFLLQSLWSSRDWPLMAALQTGFYWKNKKIKLFP
jgi:hypothetical protein